MRILSFLMACLMLMTLFSAQAAEEADYVSDFTYWADGWYARSTGEAYVFLTGEGSLEKQAELYGQVMKLALRYVDQVEAVQDWGVMDDLSWRAKPFPLLFDADAAPKPAFYAVLEAAGQEQP